MPVTRHYHQDKFATNVTSNQIAGVTTTPLNSIPSVSAPFYIALDATNVNGHYEVVDVTSKTATNINHAATSFAHSTDEEVRMVIPAEEMDDISEALSAGASGSDGWTSVSDTWTYASATTITVPSGAALLYKKGDKIKLTANSVVLYAYIITVADTLLTVAGNALTNHTFTSPAYSHQTSPIGFPDSFTYASAPTGYSGSPTLTDSRFSLNGTVCTVELNFSGTSNATTKTATLPIAAEGNMRTHAYGVNNTSVTASARAEWVAGSTTIEFYRLIDGSTWTASGTCNIQFSTSYTIN